MRISQPSVSPPKPVGLPGQRGQRPAGVHLAARLAAGLPDLCFAFLFVFIFVIISFLFNYYYYLLLLFLLFVFLRF